MKSEDISLPLYNEIKLCSNSSINFRFFSFGKKSLFSILLKFLLKIELRSENFQSSYFLLGNPILLKNEILQMKLLQPKLSILDETDSGLDIDALRIVADGVNSYKNKENAFLIITHYQRLLDYIKPDYVHVLSNGKIIKTGNADLGVQLEKTGYSNLV